MKTYLNKPIKILQYISRGKIQNGLKDVLCSFKINKKAGYDEISFNVIINCFGELRDRLKYIFSLSLGKRYFPRLYEDFQDNASF